MSVTLWLDTAAEKTIELGGTLPVYKAFSDMAKVAGDAWETDYADLSGVLTQCEDGADADPEWLADVKTQAAQFLEQYGDKAGEMVGEILNQLVEEIPE